MLPFHSTLEDFFRRNFSEEIARLGLDPSSSSITRRSMRSSAREMPASPQSATSSSIGDRRLSRAMTLGRGGPSLYVNAHLSQLYGSTPTSPHALHFDLNGSIVQTGINGGVRRDQDSQPTPLQRNLAHLARSGIPGMSHALLSGSAAVNGSPASTQMNGSGYHVDTPESHRPSKSALGTDSPLLLGKPSTASFSTFMSPKKGPYQQSTLSRNASVANSIGGRLSRFGSLLRGGER